MLEGFFESRFKFLLVRDELLVVVGQLVQLSLNLRAADSDAAGELSGLLGGGG